MVSHFDRANHSLQQIFVAGLQRRHLRSQRSRELALHRAAFANSENIDTHNALHEFLMGLDRVVVVGEPVDPGVGGREEVIVRLQFSSVVKILRSEIAGFFERHMAGIAFCLGFRRIIEAASSMT